MPAPILTITEQKSGVRVLRISIPGDITTPGEFAAAVESVAESLPGSSPVFLNGKGPVWGFAMLLHEAHATPAVAVFDPRFNGYVVVATHDVGYVVGQVIPAADVHD
ncbi:MAG: hypothetical protein AMXMBFR64_38810 [Myxococcales bacterium]